MTTSMRMPALSASTLRRTAAAYGHTGAWLPILPFCQFMIARSPASVVTAAWRRGPLRIPPTGYCSSVIGCSVPWTFSLGAVVLVKITKSYCHILIDHGFCFVAFSH